MTSILLNVSPEHLFSSESYYTLLFGRGASKVQKYAKENKNHNFSYNDLISLVETLKAQIKKKDERLEYLECMLNESHVPFIGTNILENKFDQTINTVTNVEQLSTSIAKQGRRFIPGKAIAVGDNNSI